MCGVALRKGAAVILNNVIIDRIKKELKILRNSWITVWLIIVVVLLSGAATYAAYMGTTQSKRVISLSESDDMMFSSRYLYVSDSEVQRIGFAENSTDPAVTIDVCNYDRNGMGVYGSDIYFRITAKLVNYDGTDIISDTTSEKYRLAYLDDNAESVQYIISSISNTEKTLDGPYSNDDHSGLFKLPANTKTKLKFILHFDPAALSTPQYAVEITATPVGKYEDIKAISGKLRAVSRSSQNLEWSGEFTDKLTANVDPTDFDAYNYVISGVGKGTITLTYDSSLLELDKNDLEIFSKLEGYRKTEINDKTIITFPVDTTVEDAVSRYAVHFYQKNGKAIDAFSEEYVKTEFTPA